MNKKRSAKAVFFENCYQTGFEKKSDPPFQEHAKLKRIKATKLISHEFENPSMKN